MDGGECYRETQKLVQLNIMDSMHHSVSVYTQTVSQTATVCYTGQQVTSAVGISRLAIL